MVFAFAQGRAIAGEATQVLVELSKNTTNPYDPAPIRGTGLILDADGLFSHYLCRRNCEYVQS